MQSRRSHFIRSFLRVQVVSVIAMFLAGLILSHFDAENKAMWSKEFVRCGNIQYSFENYSLAKVCYETALQYEPDNAIAKSNLGVVLYTTGMYKASTAMMREAIKLDPKNPIAYYTQAKSLMRLQRYEEAFNHAKLAVGLDPIDPIAYQTLYSAALCVKEESTAGDAYAEWTRLSSSNETIKSAETKEEPVLLAY